MRRLIVIVSSILIFAVIVYRFQGGSSKEMSRFEPHMIAHCVGRNTINLPEEFQRASIITGRFKSLEATVQDPFFEVIVNENKFTKRSFLNEIERRRSELKENSDGAVNAFRYEKVLGDDSLIFRVQRIDDAYVSEINFLRGTSLVTVKMDSFRNQYVAAEESLSKFALAFKENAIGHLGQKSPNFCLGSVEIIGNFKEESGSFLFKEGDEADFEVEINTYIPNASEPLLARMSGPDSLLKMFDVNHKVLRSGERKVVSMRAQEWLGWAKLSDEEGAKSFKFALETMRPKPSKAMPSINLTFNTGKPLPGGGAAKTILSDEEAVQIWDKVVSSIQSTAL